MRILHIHDSDGETRGAGSHIAMNRLHHGLNNMGIQSTILCRNKTPGMPDSVEIPRTAVIRLIEKVLNRVALRLGLNEIAFINSFNIVRLPEFKAADVIHIHCIHGSFFSYLALARLSRKKAVIYTMHDMWPFTGHCTVSADCERWKTGCGECPYPNEYPKIQRDNTRLEWKIKDWTYSRSRLWIGTVSTAQTAMVQKSMLKRFPIRFVAHGIDTEAYKPLDRAECRKLLDIPANRKVLMFGASDIGRRAKGMDLLLRSLQQLPPALKENLTLLTFGLGNIDGLEEVGVHAIHMGYVNNDRMKAVAYSAADLFVMPSRGESFGLVVLEGMACGTPAVAFKVGGLTDLIRPEETGLFAELENVDEFSAAIVRLLNDDTLRAQMSVKCREVAVRDFSVGRFVQDHAELYKEMLNGH